MSAVLPKHARIDRLICGLVLLAGALLWVAHGFLEAAHARGVGTVSQETDGHGSLVVFDAAPGVQRVEAQFPFGLTVALHFDAMHGHWHAPVAAPEAARKGHYPIAVKQVFADGKQRWTYADYVVDPVARLFELTVDEAVVAGEYVEVLVDPNVPLADVTVYFERLPAPEARLTRNRETGLYHLEVPIPHDFEGRDFDVRVVVSDGKRGRAEQRRTIEVIPAIDCCHEEPEEDC